MSQLVTLHIDSKPVSVLCHLGDFGCGDGGWTTVMKIDGNKVCHLSTGAIFIEHIINGPEKKNVLYILLGEARKVWFLCDDYEQYDRWGVVSISQRSS